MERRKALMLAGVFSLCAFLIGFVVVHLPRASGRQEVSTVRQFSQAERPPPSRSSADVSQEGRGLGSLTHAPERRVPKPSSGPVYAIEGTVIHSTLEVPPDFFDELASAQSEEEVVRLFRTPRPRRPAAGAIVTATGGPTGEQVVVTDSEGHFRIVGLAGAVYEVSAEVQLPPLASGTKRVSTGKSQVTLLADVTSMTLECRYGDRFSITGKITDADGRPIAGAKVSGEPYPVPESQEITPPTRHAVSGPDGVYELQGFAPASIRTLAGYLYGGDPTHSGMYAFFVEVHAKAEGFVEAKERVPRVPPVTEDALDVARQFHQAMRQVQINLEGSSKFDEQEDLRVPVVRGHTVTGIDIVLERGEAPTKAD